MRLPLLLNAMLATALSSCATMNVLQEAKGGEYTLNGKDVVGVERDHPEAYLLLPVTVPVDIVTSPLQLFYFFFIFRG